MPQSNDEANIILALDALQNDPKLRIRRAASIYQVCHKKLGRRQRGIQSQRDTTPKSRKLSDLEEQIIIQFILDLDSRGFPPRLRGVEEMANRLLARTGLQTSLSGIQSLRHVSFASITIRELNVKTRLLFAIGSRS
jgi:hypothetical protein